MILDVNGEYEVDDPSYCDLDDAMSQLGDDEFMILAADEEMYIQMYVEADFSDSVIEYRDGSADRHFQAPLISIKKALQAFMLYLDRDPQFKGIHEWSLLDLSQDETE